MRTRHTMTVSLPPAMVREVEAVRKAEHRTRSELIREALRTYFNVRRSYTPTASELRAIERGRAALRRGAYVTVDDLRTALGTAHKQARAKNVQRAPRPERERLTRALDEMPTESVPDQDDVAAWEVALEGARKPISARSL